MNRFTKLAVCLALPLSGAMGASAAVASTATTTFAVTATVIDSCGVSATSLAFGDYNSISGGMLDAAAMISPICTSGTVYSVALNAGQGSGALPSSRKLTGPVGVTLNYGIFTDSARSSVWGDGTGGTGMRIGTGNGNTQPVMMYGRIPAAQAGLVGSYSDTVTVTLTY